MPSQQPSFARSTRHAVPRRNFSLVAERAALIRSLRSAENNWFAMCSDFRDAGTHWKNIKSECKHRKIAPENGQRKTPRSA
jgi:hypothetical protein